jgi:hypothetical protein
MLLTKIKSVTALVLLLGLLGQGGNLWGDRLASATQAEAESTTHKPGHPAVGQNQKQKASAVRPGRPIGELLQEKFAFGVEDPKTTLSEALKEFVHGYPRPELDFLPERGPILPGPLSGSLQ